MFGKNRLIILMILSIVFTNTSCLPAFVCENTVEKEVLSPNGKNKAVIFDRGCGATTGFMTVISVFPANHKLSNDEKDYVLFADNVYQNESDNNGQIQLGSFNFDVKWINNEELLVLYTESKNLSKKDSFNNIKIRYELIQNDNRH